MRKDLFIIGQYYHIYNRGTDKRIIFMDKFDLGRFLQGMREFNTVESIGSLFMHNRKNNSRHRVSTIIEDNRLVEIVVYSLNPNHFHFILSPLVEKGIEKFIHKLSMGYAKYFNEKYKRSGVLFQGKYKSIHIGNDEYLMYLSGYVNLNNDIHRLRSRASKSQESEDKLFWKSSWDEYLGKNKENFCNKSIILDRYKNVANYKEFAESVAEGIIERRIDESVNLGEDLLIEKLK